MTKAASVNTGENRLLPKTWGISVALSGLVLSLAVLVVDSWISPPGSTVLHSRIVKVSIDLLTLIGMTMLTMGLLTILLDTRSWKSYFETGLKNVVLDQSYLNRLSRDELKALQVNSLKAFYRGEHLEREGSFLSYCSQNIHQYVGSPYREDVYDEIVVENFDPATGVAKVYEKLGYVCRKGGELGLIQPEVTWQPDPNEYLESPIPVCKLSLKYPETDPKSGQPLRGPEELSSPKYSYSLAEAKLQDRDGLVVVLELWYSVPISKLQNWCMGYPTKNFTLIITYPDVLNVQLKEFVSHPDRVQITRKEGYFSLKYSTWLLPDQNGVAWNFFLVNGKAIPPPPAADKSEAPRMEGPSGAPRPTESQV